MTHFPFVHDGSCYCCFQLINKHFSGFSSSCFYFSFASLSHFGTERITCTCSSRKRLRGNSSLSWGGVGCCDQLRLPLARACNCLMFSSVNLHNEVSGGTGDCFTKLFSVIFVILKPGMVKIEIMPWMRCQNCSSGKSSDWVGEIKWVAKCNTIWLKHHFFAVSLSFVMQILFL